MNLAFDRHNLKRGEAADLALLTRHPGRIGQHLKFIVRRAAAIFQAGFGIKMSELVPQADSSHPGTADVSNRWRPRCYSPNSVRNFPLLVWRIARAIGVYRPARYLIFCSRRLGSMNPSTCEMPRDRLTLRLAAVTTRRVLTELSHPSNRWNTP